MSGATRASGAAMKRVVGFANNAAAAGRHGLSAAQQQQTRSFARTASALGVKKIAVANPVVDLDGDEMTRIIW